MALPPGASSGSPRGITGPYEIDPEQQESNLSFANGTGEAKDLCRAEAVESIPNYPFESSWNLYDFFSQQPLHCTFS